MFKKLNIKIFKVPILYNSGFIFDYSNNSIINIENNYILPLPFKTTLINTLYLFELLSGPDYLILTIILNTVLCNSFIYSYDLLGYKKELFNILNNRDGPRQSFKKISNILNILDRSSYEFNSPGIIKINKNKFIDLATENIEQKENIIRLYRPNLFMVIGNTVDLNSNYEYCIVDSLSNLIPEFTIHNRNCNNICVDDLYNWQNIHISDSFFFSKKYSSQYSKYHSNYKSRYAYNNYKKHFNTLNNEEYCFNVELTENKIFILKNINIKKLIHHPIIHSNNTIIIIKETIKRSDIINLELIFNRKYNKQLNINYNESLYLDTYKYYIYKLYLNLTKIEKDSFSLYLKNLCKIQHSIIIIYKYHIPDSCINNDQLELYQYSEELLIENITSPLIIIDTDITIYDFINVIGGSEIYNLKNVYKIS